MLDPIKNDLIFYYKNVIQDYKNIVDLIEETDSECDENSLISKWKDWKTSSEVPYIFGKQKIISNSFMKGGKVYSLTESLKEKNDKLENIYITLKDTIESASQHYAKENDIYIGTLSPLSIGKYNTGSYMGPHCDTYSEHSNATISVVLYLNDDYDGGELHFPNQDVKIKPEAGSIIVFPSRPPYMHASLEITKGIKYISPGFWYK